MDSELLDRHLRPERNIMAGAFRSPSRAVARSTQPPSFAMTEAAAR
jgi:hypothetical protein